MMTIDKSGNVKFAGALGDGTAVSFAGVPTLEEDEAGERLFVPVCFVKGTSFLFGHVIVKSAGVDVIGATKLVKGEVVWGNTNAASTYDLAEGGFEFDVDVNGAFYDKLINLQRYYYETCGNALSVNSRLDTDEDYADLFGVKGAVGAPLLGASEQGLSFTGGKVVIDKQKLVKDAVVKARYLLDESTNASGLSLTFTQATGIFKGKYDLWFENENQLKVQVKQSVSCAGVFVVGGDGVDGGYGHSVLKIKRPDGKTTWTGTWEFVISQ